MVGDAEWRDGNVCLVEELYVPRQRRQADNKMKRQEKDTGKQKRKNLTLAVGNSPETKDVFLFLSAEPCLVFL